MCFTKLSAVPSSEIESGISAAGLIPAASINDDPTREKLQGTASTRLSTRVCVCVCVCVERDLEHLREEEEDEEEWQNEAPASENLSSSLPLSF